MLAHRRRLFALGLLLVGITLISWSFLRQRQRAAESSPPRPIPRARRSVLLVTTDTTRADHLEPYGAEDVATPTLLALAREGITFESAYSVAPITLVAHTTILTGLWPPEHGVRNNGMHRVPEEVETLAERLRDQGFATAAFVSAAVLDHRYRLDQGFDVYDDDLSAGRDRLPRAVADRPAEATVSAARAWLDALPSDRRFFLWVHLYDPHAAYSPPPPYRDRYRERLYDGEIAYMDSQIGRLLEHPRLEAAAGSEGPLVVILGDHGESLGEHGEQTHALLAYDGTLRVPFLLRIPGGPRGMHVPVPVGQADLVPTLLDLLELPSAEGLRGASLVPLLEGRQEVVLRDFYAETYLPFYTYGWAKLRVLRRGSWKWIDAPTPELYDLRRDPEELTNLAEDQPGLSHDLGRDLSELLAGVGGGERESTLALDDEARERLRSLGYLAAGSGAPRRQGVRPDPKEMVDLHVGLERARTLLQQRLFPQAESQLRQVLARDPGNLAALVDLATARGEQGRLDEAVGLVERALRLDPNYSRLYLQLAGFEARRGNREKALEVLDRALEIDPQLIEARIQKALQLRFLGRKEASRKLLEEVLEEHPGEPRLEVVYAQRVELEEGRVEAAEARVRRALERDPFEVAGWRLLGQILERTSRSEEAAEAYRKGLRRQPDDADLHARLGLLLARLHAGGEAEAHLREALRLGTEERLELHVALGAWLAERGRVEEAQAEYARVLEVEPGHPGARNNRAIALYRSGQLEEAEAELEALVRDHPGQMDAYNNLAALALERGDWETAARRARRALSLSPRIFEAWSNLGMALDGLGRGSEAREAYGRALQIEPGYWQARLNLGVSLRRDGYLEEAKTELEGLVQDLPGLAEAHLELGRFYDESLGQPARARPFYNAFLRLAPQHPEAPAVRRALRDLPSGSSDSTDSP